MAGEFCAVGATTSAIICAMISDMAGASGAMISVMDR